MKFKILYLIYENAFVFRYFATGHSVRSFAFSFRMDSYTAGKIIDQVSDVLWSKLSSKHLTFPDHDRFLDIAVKFRERWNFPNVVGCIKCPAKAGSLFYNYKIFLFSVVLQGVSHSESRFIFIDTGAYGKQIDGDTYSASA